jgi:hypothetical protein
LRELKGPKALQIALLTIKRKSTEEGKNGKQAITSEEQSIFPLFYSIVAVYGYLVWRASKIWRNPSVLGASRLVL